MIYCMASAVYVGLILREDNAVAALAVDAAAESGISYWMAKG